MVYVKQQKSSTQVFFSISIILKMKRQNNFIHQVYIADGFADDCEELIHRWLKIDTHTYKTFCEIWKDMQFGFIYHGRTTGTEMAELSEELLHIAKHYMVANTSNFEESVAGLFLVYGVLNLQPYQGFAALRIVPDDVPAINRIEMVARREKRYDVLYILGSVLTRGPVQYHAAARERGMEPSIRKYFEGYTSIDRLGVRPKGVFYRQNEELDLIRELSSVTRRYADAKKAVAGECSNNLNYTNTQLASEFEHSLKKIINGAVEEGDDSEDKITEHFTNVQAIKDRAMRQLVEGVKFLRSKNNIDKPSEKEDLTENSDATQTPSKRKKPSPKKSLASLRKRKPKAKRKKRNSSESSASSSSLDLELSTASDTRSEADSLEKSIGTEDSNPDINLENFDREKPQETDEREINIEIDSLPVYILTEDNGTQFEIEIIDKCKNKPNDRADKGEDAKAELDDVSIEKFEAEASTSGSKPLRSSPRIRRLEEKAKQNNIGLKKKDKRDNKKTVLKSKFKRMGMLELANMDDGAKEKETQEKKGNSGN